MPLYDSSLELAHRPPLLPRAKVARFAFDLRVTQYAWRYFRGWSFYRHSLYFLIIRLQCLGDLLWQPNVTPLIHSEFLIFDNLFKEITRKYSV